jgi:hypothetical protein
LSSWNHDVSFSAMAWQDFFITEIVGIEDYPAASCRESSP